MSNFLIRGIPNFASVQTFDCELIEKVINNLQLQVKFDYAGAIVTDFNSNIRRTRGDSEQYIRQFNIGHRYSKGNRDTNQ
jgi:hypothetical protein